MVEADAPFIVELFNDPEWLRLIGDRGIRSADEAQAYIRTGPQDMYSRLGFGLWVAELKSSGAPIGICGLLKREALADVDLGYALLPAHRRQGFAREAAAATVTFASSSLGLRRLAAIVSPENAPSVRLLDDLGFRFERSIRLAPTSKEVNLFSSELASP